MKKSPQIFILFFLLINTLNAQKLVGIWQCDEFKIQLTLRENYSYKIEYANTNSVEDKEEKSVKLEIRMQFMSDETENNILNFIVGGKSKSTEGVQQSVS